MGLFGGKKTYVSSVAYNMAGDQKDRPNYLKTSVISSIISNRNYSVAEDLTQTYLHGPGIKLRSFYQWAVDNYGAIGVPVGFTSGASDLPATVVAGAIPHASNETVNVSKVDIGLSDFSYWAEQFMLTNYPDLINTDWLSDYNDTTGQIVITFADNSVTSFTPVGFTKLGTFIYATYTLIKGSSDGPVATGSVITLGSGEAFPDVSTWTVESTSTTNVPVTLNQRTDTVSSYSDGRPNTTSSNTVPNNTTYEEYTDVYSNLVYAGYIDGYYFFDDKLVSNKTIETQGQTGSVIVATTTNTTTTDIGGGVTRTDNNTVKTDTIKYTHTYRDDTQEVIIKSYSKPKIYIYKVGSGNSDLDALVETTGNDGGYLPYIPIRLDNKFISENYLPDIYDLVKRAYKKDTRGSKFDDLVDKVADNPSLGDIDYAYIMHGISLNCIENAGRKYMYDFFRKIMLTQSTTEADYDQWADNQNDYAAYMIAHAAWVEGQKDHNDPLFDTPEPMPGVHGAPPVSSIRIQSQGTAGLNTNLNIQITWQSIAETLGTGLKKPDAKVGELWLENLPSTIFRSSGDNIVIDKFDINWQVSADSWQTLTITGLVHKNYIYDGKYVEIGSKAALDDIDESGFIIPLHYQTLKEMSLIDSTQLSTCCTYILFNSYLVVKQKWYQTGIFKIILIAVIIAVIYFTGGFAAIGGGVLGSAATVGASVGLTGLAAVIVGAAANAIAGMIIMKIITLVSVEIFGEKFGAIIGAIAGTVAIMYASPGSGSFNFETLLKPENLFTLSMAAGNGYAGLVRADTMDIMQDTQKLQTDYQKEAKRIAELYAKNIGYGNASFNPLELVDATDVYIETGDEFLSRTLLTGTDISELTMNLLSRFADLNLTIALPTND